MSAEEEIANPAMRQMWRDVKKAADIMAGKKKQDKAYKDHEKQFSQDLGPNLKRWPSYYPNLGKMNTERLKIELIIKNYAKFNLIAKTKKTLDKAVLKILNEGLQELKDNLVNRTAIAESMLMSDPDTAEKVATKESKAVAKKPKALTVMEIFQDKDISAIIKKNVPGAENFLILSELSIGVQLTDDKALAKIDPNNDALITSVRDAANYKLLIREIALAYKAAALSIKKEPSKGALAQRTFEAAVDTSIRDATARASEQMRKDVGIRVEYRNYKIKSGIKLTLAIVGTTAGAASLALAPFTGPAMVISAMGVAKGAKVIGDQIADLSMSAEEMISELQRDVKGLQKRYRDWKGGGIGSAEVTSTLINAVLPTILPTIKRCASHCDTAGEKIKGLQIKTQDMSIKVNETLNEQEKMVKAFSGWIRDNKAYIDGKLSVSSVKLLKNLKENEVRVGQLVEKVSTLSTRVRLAAADQKKMGDAIAGLSAREPTIAKFAEVFVEVGASVGFLVSANVGWPDAYAIGEAVKGVTDTIGNVVGSLDGAVGAAEEVKGFVDDLRT